MRRGAIALILALMAGMAQAHDIWIEALPSVATAGHSVRLSLLLGNHGNGHRDYKPMGRVSAAAKSLLVVEPSGRKVDLSGSLIEQGSDELGWVASFRPTVAGWHLAVSTFDQVMSYAPVRDIKSAKTFFVVHEPGTPSEHAADGFDLPRGHALELVLLEDPFFHERIRVQVLFQGKPLSNADVSFIPRGAKAKPGFDPKYQRRTRSDGTAEIRLPRPGTDVLVSVHRTDERASGPGYESIHYSATLWIQRP